LDEIVIPCKYVLISVAFAVRKKLSCFSETAYPIIKTRHLIFPFTGACPRQIARSISCPWRWALHSRNVHNFQFNLGLRLKFRRKQFIIISQRSKWEKMKTLATLQS